MCVRVMCVRVMCVGESKECLIEEVRESASNMCESDVRESDVCLIQELREGARGCE